MVAAASLGGASTPGMASPASIGSAGGGVVLMDAWMLCAAARPRNCVR